MADSVTNPSKSEEKTAQKYANPSNSPVKPVGNFRSGGGGDFGGGGAGGSWDEPEKIPSGNSDAGAGRSSSAFTLTDPRRLDLPVPPGAEKPKPADPQITTVTQKQEQQDLRVKIRVPPEYYSTNLTRGAPKVVGAPTGDIETLTAVIWPYTPNISFDVKAEYSNLKPLHSNFLINFYQRSYIESIQIAGKFTVENVWDAMNYISTMHILKAITRMKFGTDSEAGSPPPVCRLDAHGDMMLRNVPVAVTNYRVEWPDDVDYFTISNGEVYGPTAVPTRSTIAVTCIPMYSRDEMKNFGVDGYLNQRNDRGYI